VVEFVWVFSLDREFEGSFAAPGPGDAVRNLANPHHLAVTAASFIAAFAFVCNKYCTVREPTRAHTAWDSVRVSLINLIAARRIPVIMGIRTPLPIPHYII
jgi:hypothetical protein